MFCGCLRCWPGLAAPAPQIFLSTSTKTTTTVPPSPHPVRMFGLCSMPVKPRGAKNKRWARLNHDFDVVRRQSSRRRCRLGILGHGLRAALSPASSSSCGCWLAGGDDHCSASSAATVRRLHYHYRVVVCMSVEPISWAMYEINSRSMGTIKRITIDR